MGATTIDNLAERIASGFLKHASEIPGENWRERWLWVNRAAGIIVGFAIASLPLNDAPAEEIAQRLAAEVVAKIPEGKTERTLAEGLNNRIIKCFLALEGRSQDADALTAQHLRSLRDQLARQKGRMS